MDSTRTFANPLPVRKGKPKPTMQHSRKPICWPLTRNRVGDTTPTLSLIEWNKDGEGEGSIDTYLAKRALRALKAAAKARGVTESVILAEVITRGLSAALGEGPALVQLSPEASAALRGTAAKHGLVPESLGASLFDTLLMAAQHLEQEAQSMKEGRAA